MKILWTDTCDNSRTGNLCLREEVGVVVARWHTRDGEPFTYFLSVFTAPGTTTEEMKKGGWTFKEFCKHFSLSIHSNDPFTLRKKLDEVFSSTEHVEAEEWVRFNPLK